MVSLSQTGKGADPRDRGWGTRWRERWRESLATSVSTRVLLCSYCSPCGYHTGVEVAQGGLLRGVGSSEPRVPAQGFRGGSSDKGGQPLASLCLLP